MIRVLKGASLRLAGSVDMKNNSFIQQNRGDGFIDGVEIGSPIIFDNSSLSGRLRLNGGVFLNSFLRPDVIASTGEFYDLEVRGSGYDLNQCRAMGREVIEGFYCRNSTGLDAKYIKSGAFFDQNGEFPVKARTFTSGAKVTNSLISSDGRVIGSVVNSSISANGYVGDIGGIINKTCQATTSILLTCSDFISEVE